ncbi:MAG: alpha/beta hydrolase [Anaerolineaceae bacterium]
MPYIESQGVRIYYHVIEGRGETAPDGEPLVLLHGFTASSRTNWEFPGIATALSATNRLILVDFRGHGKSAKPIRSRSYSKAILTADVIAVMDELNVPRARVFGYSMGAMIAAELLLTHPARFSAAILGGMGVAWPSRGKGNGRDEEPEGFEPPEIHQNRSPGRLLRYFTQTNGLAMGAAWRGIFRGQAPMDTARLHEIRVPVLAIVGSRDRFCSGTRALAQLIPDCQRVVVPGRGHLGTIADPALKAAAIEFLAEVREPAEVLH